MDVRAFVVLVVVVASVGRASDEEVPVSRTEASLHGTRSRQPDVSLTLPTERPGANCGSQGRRGNQRGKVPTLPTERPTNRGSQGRRGNLPYTTYRTTGANCGSQGRRGNQRGKATTYRTTWCKWITRTPRKPKR